MKQKTNQEIIKMPYGSIPILAKEFETSKQTAMRAINGTSNTYLSKRIRKRAKEMLVEIE